MSDSQASPGQPIAASHPLDENILARHRAKVLRPEEVPPPYQPVDAKDPVPALLPTIYRYEHLLVPEDLLSAREMSDDGFGTFLSATLHEVGLALTPAERATTDPVAAARATAPADAAAGTAGHPGRPGEREQTGRGPARAAEAARAGSGQLMRLVPAAGQQVNHPIDSWRVLQMIRAAADAESLRATHPTAGHPTAGHGAKPARAAKATRRSEADRVSLEHLLFGADGNVSGDGASVEGHPGGGFRMPVMLPLSTPPWVPDFPGRRPVVAILDTGLQVDPVTGTPAHPWLADGARLILNYLGAEDPEGGTSYVRPLLGDLDSHSGHGTFIAGIVRQLAPAAEIRAVRIMHSDGIVYESDLEDALDRLHDMVAGGDFIDIVSMSFGWYDENGDSPQATRIRAKLQALTDLGVIVVASAGNDAAATPPVFPAGFSSQLSFSVAGQPPQPAVLAAGAKSSPSKHAIFTNEATWVNVWYEGSSIVSTMPSALRGGRQPSRRARAATDTSRPRGRQGFDPDDFEYGFGVWSGTSFAAAICAGTLAKVLSDQAGTLATTPVSPIARAHAAVAELMAQQDQDNPAGDGHPEEAP